MYQAASVITCVRLDKLYIFFGLGIGFYQYDWHIDYNDNDAAKDESYSIWGPNGSIGVQAMITKRFGFIADIGMEYRFFGADFKEWDAAGTIITDYTDYEEQFTLRSAYLGAVFYIRSQ